MFLSGVLLALFLAGCWLYCLTDAVLMPAREFRRLRKEAWITVIAATFILGAVSWAIARYLNRRRAVNLFLAAEALARHPASKARQADGRTTPIGPDDDPEFLRMLDRLISGTSDSGELLPSCYMPRTAARVVDQPGHAGLSVLQVPVAVSFLDHLKVILESSDDAWGVTVTRCGRFQVEQLGDRVPGLASELACCGQQSVP